MSGWIWYELMTTDQVGAKAFYDAVVGWNITPGSEQTGGYGFITRPDGGMTGGLLTLTADMQAGGARPGWLGYVHVPDVDAAVTSIEHAGGRCHMPARDVPGAGRIAMVADCCGAPFYVMTPTPPPGGGESTAFSANPRPGSCGWNELCAGQFDAALAFYAGQFGWEPAGSMDMGEMGTYQFIADAGVTIGAIMPRPPEMPASSWMHYFWVDSAGAAAARIAQHGGQVLMGPHEVPGPLWIVQALDPQGAMFALVGAR